MNFPTRDRNILDQVYCNTPRAYNAAAAPHFGMSDHIFVELFPAYRPLICRICRTIKVWTEKATLAVQDLFEHTDWGVFKEGANHGEYTSSVLSYIHLCTDAVLPTKTIKVFPNQKLW